MKHSVLHLGPPSEEGRAVHVRSVDRRGRLRLSGFEREILVEASSPVLLAAAFEPDATLAIWNAASAARLLLRAAEDG